MTEQENNNKDLQMSMGLAKDEMTKMFNAWSEMMKIPTIGPGYAFSRDFESYSEEFIKLGKIIAELKRNADQYWSLLNMAQVRASKDTAERSPKQFASKEDFENYRRAMIEAFEDSFTGLFDSKEFAEVYGRLFSSQLDLLKTLQSITEKNFKILNLPTRNEVDEILKDVHELKKTVHDMKRSFEEAKKNEPEPARNA